MLWMVPYWELPGILEMTFMQCHKKKKLMKIEQLDMQHTEFDISCELQGLRMRNLQGIVLLYSPASLGDFQRSIIIRLSFQWKATECILFHP